MKRLAALSFTLFILILAVACGGAAGSRGLAPMQPAAAPTSAPAATMAAAAPEIQAQAGDPSGLASSLAQLDAARMVVYTGSITLEVNDTDAVVAKIADILKANQGYISSRSLDRDSQGYVRGSITIRVPTGALDATLAQIKATALKVLHEDAKSNDVTAEYTDLDARRKNLESYEVELTQLLDTVRQRTGKAEDILAVYNQLTNVRSQIDQIKGQQNLLQNTSDLATYTIEFVPHEEVTVIEEGWNPGSTARTALHALVQALQALGDILITFVLFVLPLLVLIALPFGLLFWLARRLFRRRAAKAPGVV